MVEQRLQPNNVVGVFHDVDHAVEVASQLTEDFDPSSELSLLGPEEEMRPAAKVVRDRRRTGTSGGTTAMSGLREGLLGGTGIGVAGGAAVLSLAAIALPGIGTGFGALGLYALSGAVGGGTVGALLGMESAGRRATMWQQTLSPLLERVQEEGAVLVGVHVDDPDRAAQARKVLEDHTEEVASFNAELDYTPEHVESNIGDRVPSGSPTHPGSEGSTITNE